MKMTKSLSISVKGDIFVNTKTKTNFKRVLSVFLTLLMVVSVVSVGFVFPASAEGDPQQGTYTVTWKSGDDILEIDENVPYGTMPSYDGETPTKETAGDVIYSFSKWSPDVAAVSGDVTYNATFTTADRLYAANFTDNLGNSYSLEKARGTVWPVVLEGYKVAGMSATYGTCDVAAQTYTFSNNETADTVTITYVLDVTAVLAAARNILENSSDYDNSDGYIDDLQQAYDDLIAIQNDPEQLEEAAALKETILSLVAQSASHQLTGQAIITFWHGKNGDVPTIIDTLSVGDPVVAPPASVTSYISAGFSYPVAYWVDGDDNHYTNVFPAAVSGTNYYAVYTLYDLYDDLAAIRTAKAIETVTDAGSINAINNVLSQIDTLFAENGVTVSDYMTVQQNHVDKETAAGQSFIDMLQNLIGQLQSVANSAPSICSGHEFDYYDQKTPSCTQPGYLAYKVCRLCSTKVGGEEVPATGHSTTYVRDPARSGALTDGTCAWETYTCKNGCGDFYLIPTYIVRYTDGSTVSGATVTLFVDGENISVFADNGGRANFRGRIPSGELKEGEYDLTVTLGENAKTGTMIVHNGRVSVNIARFERPDQGEGNEGNNGGSSGEFRCPMCNAYDELRSMPVVGWFVAIVHFFVHMAYRVADSSTGFSGKFSFGF